MNKVLILYGTRYGTTKGISDEIERLIQESGLSTDSFNLNKVKLKDIPALDKYDGILIGTSIKIGKWTKVVKSFMQKRKAELKKRQNLLGFYVCCGEAKTNINNAKQKYINPNLEKLGIQPALIDAFAGAFDLREGSALSGMMRKIVIGMMQKEEGIENPDGELFDYRDWDQIRNFGNQFVELIKNNP